MGVFPLVVNQINPNGLSLQLLYSIHHISIIVISNIRIIMNLITKYFLTKYKLLEIRKIVLDLEERNLVNILNLLVKSNPDVKFGSYPFIDHPDFKTIITVEGYNEEKGSFTIIVLFYNKLNNYNNK
jgi:hypothetical protein